MRSTHAILLLVASLGLLGPGCRKGPDRDALQAEIQDKLDTAFGEGVFRVTGFDRRGSYPYQEEGEETDRLLVYFDAEIEFAKDTKLSGWDQMNVGSLTTVLGATPKGVEGVEPAGNKAGDVLQVRGSSAYLYEGGEWVRSTQGPAEAKTRAELRPGSDERSGYKKRLDSIAEVGAKLQLQGAAEDLDELERTLRHVLSAAQRKLAKREGLVTIATGTAEGVYASFGRDLEGVLTSAGSPARAFVTAGSLENCELVANHEVVFALAQNDVVHMAHGGSALFVNRSPLKDLRAVCTLYPEPIQVVAAPGIRSFEELKDRAVAIGPEGSGIRVNALQIIEAAGMNLGTFRSVRSLTTSSAADALARGEIDAFFVTGAAPMPQVSRLTSAGKARLLPLPGSLLGVLKAKGQGWFVPVTIGRGTYPGMRQNVATLAVTATIITHADTPPPVVKDFLTKLYAAVPELSRKNLQAYMISRDTALEGLSGIPKHPAAADFFGAK